MIRVLLKGQLLIHENVFFFNFLRSAKNGVEYRLDALSIIWDFLLPFPSPFHSGEPKIQELSGEYPFLSISFSFFSSSEWLEPRASCEQHSGIRPVSTLFLTISLHFPLFLFHFLQDARRKDKYSRIGGSVPSSPPPSRQELQFRVSYWHIFQNQDTLQTLIQMYRLDVFYSRKQKNKIKKTKSVLQELKKC